MEPQTTFKMKRKLNQDLRLFKKTVISVGLYCRNVVRDYISFT